ncbi:MAG: hypothetical protein HUU50_11800 [Candidatus Brocadiae bacterium]|nr:hypothetical protein [Candidatus Brocadiia bacterium]
MKNLEVEVSLSEEKPTIGKSSQLQITMRLQEKVWFRYMFFELINERTDKRAPMDRVTSRSRYFYRYNIDKEISQETENKHTFSLRIPIHKEPSRNDKFICIKWQLSAKAIVSKTEEDSNLLSAEATPMELEVM